MCEVYVDGDGCDVWVNTWHRARKPRRCQSCGCDIAAGDRYLRHFDVYDGSVNVEFLCGPCGLASEAFLAEHGGMPNTPASIADTLSACIDEDDDSRRRWQPVLDELRARERTARR